MGQGSPRYHTSEGRSSLCSSPIRPRRQIPCRPDAGWAFLMCHRRTGTMKRRIIAVPVIVSLLGAIQAVAPVAAQAAPPTLSPSSRLLGWRGNQFAPAAVRGPQSCTPDSCDRFPFRVKLPLTFWNSRLGGVRVWIRWQSPQDDFDLYVYRRDKLVGSSPGDATSAGVFIRRAAPGDYEALVVPVNVVFPVLPSHPGYGAIARLEARPQTPKGVSVRYVPSRIAADCSRDVSGELLRWIARVPDHSTFVFGHNACYRIDGTLRIEDRWGLAFFGNEATFRAGTDGDQGRRHWWFLGGGDLVIRDMTVVGANPDAGVGDAAYRPDREFQHAFDLAGVQGALLDNLKARDVYGDFVYIGNDNRTEGNRWSSGITLQNSHFERNGRQGISICAAEDVLVRWNYLGQLRRATFDIEPALDHWGALNVRIMGNVTGPGRLLWFANGGVGSNVSDIRIANNTMIGVPGAVMRVIALDGAYRGPFLLEGNNFIVGGDPMASFTRTVGITVRNNLAWFDPAQLKTAVALHASSAVLVTGNAFPGAGTVLAADAESSNYVEYDNTT